jgi:hypothetical protein
MANIRIPSGTGGISITGTVTGSGTQVFDTRKIVTLNTKDTYVLENIDVYADLSINVQAGTLSNEASSGVTYTPNTAASTILPAEGTLYINEGWYPNTSVTLAHMIPDDVSYSNAGSNQILSGFEAYDVDGKKLIGTLATVDPTFNGGDVTATATVGTITKPTATIESAGTFKTASTYGVTTAQPSTGTDGTNYLTIDGTITKGTGSVTATATANRTAVNWYQNTTGHISKATGDVALAAPATAATNTSAASSIDVTLTDNFAPLYIPIVTASFGGGVITPIASGEVGTAPKVTYSASAAGKNSGGSSITLSNYGVETTTNASSNGYITFTASGEATDGAVKAKANATSTAVTYTNSAGAIAAHDGAIATTPTSSGQASVDVTVTPTAQAGTTTKYRIPIVTPTGTGGGLTVSGGSITNLSGTAPSVTPSATGTFLPSGTGNVGGTYGVTTSTPTSGTDGTNYVTITPSGTAGSGQAYTATVNLTYNRAAVTTDADYKGAVSMASGDTLLAAANNQNASRANVSVGTIQATVGSPSTSYYIPIVTPVGHGGGVTKNDSGNSGAVTGTPPTVTLGESGTLITNATTYGVVTSQASGTTYVSITPTGSTTTKGSYSGTATISYTRAAVTPNGDFIGLVNMDDDDEFLGSTTGTLTHTLTSASNIDATIAANPTTYYIPVITVPSTSSVSNSVINPTVDLTAGVAYGGTGAPSGSVSGFTSTQPSSGAYVVITPGKNVTSGTVTSTVSSITIDKGITAGGTITGGTDTDNIGVTNGTTTNYYVKIYDGTYTVA